MGIKSAPKPMSSIPMQSTGWGLFPCMKRKSTHSQQGACHHNGSYVDFSLCNNECTEQAKGKSEHQSDEPPMPM